MRLAYNWTLLGLRQGAAALRAPALRVPPQQARSFAVGGQEEIVVPAARKGAVDSTEGVILLLE